MLYFLLVSLPLLFGAEVSGSSLFSYNFDPIEGGLANLGLVVGFWVAGIFQMQAQTMIYRHLSKKHGEGRPEYRLLPMTVWIDIDYWVTTDDVV
jgi:hypothetical protein